VSWALARSESASSPCGSRSHLRKSGTRRARHCFPHSPQCYTQTRSACQNDPALFQTTRAAAGEARPLKKDTLMPKHRTFRDCDRELSRQRPGHAQAQDGEIWTCPCGLRFEHICDEAEGCSWGLVISQQKPSYSGKVLPPEKPPKVSKGAAAEARGAVKKRKEKKTSGD